ncbi:hypothetical protein UFOVP244_153 [uncultured Caudovirales phage]|uniref:Uncharacterized protein n=1 Tax=uncultured Caudovirales phage TaxID=2100421 RepID=A0A6J7WZA1_9CAUD|nr:hypothetical protein UFOVP244_153 [uncultured Caudovirales phage]
MKSNLDNRAIATAVTSLVMDRLNTEDGPLGPLRDFHMKWMMEFTKWLFASEAASITIDLSKTAIYLTPAGKDGKALSKTTFDRVYKTQRVSGLSSRLPGSLGLDRFTITFKRVKPRGATSV